MIVLATTLPYARCLAAEIAPGYENSLDAGSERSSSDLALEHVKDSLSTEAYDNFRLFIYVNKSSSGPLGQQMYVFQKSDNGDLALLDMWPVSTGRNLIERDARGHIESSYTPRGYFELDPKRLFEDHVSGQWNEAMPFAMFFDWRPHGKPTGLAIHGAPDGAADLGTPTSAGCIRLSVEDAQTLFNLVQTQFHGPAPKLAYLDGDEGMSSNGLFLHGPDGNLQMADGYQVLVLVDGYDASDRIASND